MSGWSNNNFSLATFIIWGIATKVIPNETKKAIKIFNVRLRWGSIREKKSTGIVFIYFTIAKVCNFTTK
jgi:hypothetical protein